MKKTTLCLLAAGILAASPVQAGDFLKWLTGCNADAIEGSGDVVTESRDLKEFTRIESSGCFDIYVTVGKEQEVTLTFDDNLIDLIETRVRGKRLKISCDENISSHRSCKIEISVPALEAVRMSGSGDMEIYDLTGDFFEYTISGSGDMRAEGQVDEVEIKVTGSGDVDTRDLVTQEAAVSVTGSGDVKVHTSDSFYGRVSGSGDIDVYGNPEHMSRHVSGSGDIRKRR